LAALLRDRFPGMSARQVARKAGVTATSLHRVWSGGGPPSLEFLIKLCCAAGDHPSLWLEAAGWTEMAVMMRECCGQGPESETATAREARKSLERLIARGQEAKALTSLHEIEAGLDGLREHFRLALENQEIEAAVLLANHRMRGDLLAFHGCSEVKALALAAAQDDLPQGWGSTSLSDTRLEMEFVCLVRPKQALQQHDCWQKRLQDWGSILRELWS
ncbi:MAG TPA: helix-turn-helix domain-containing protein, partial [Acidobacteriota bacterium]|nr:helix-turn-helix domain-containing protein [Acidobacteriota bacterium]